MKPAMNVAIARSAAAIALIERAKGQNFDVAAVTISEAIEELHIVYNAYSGMHNLQGNQT